MQKGFATLEVVIVIFIIAILMGAAIPNAVLIIDRVALDYETKRLYTDLRAVQSFDRIASMQDGHFGKPDNFGSISNVSTTYKELVNLHVVNEKYTIAGNAFSTVYAEHYFSNGVTADKGKIIRFDDMGKVTPADSDTLYLTSRLGRKTAIVFDSVGRFRGGRQ